MLTERIREFLPVIAGTIIVTPIICKFLLLGKKERFSIVELKEKDEEGNEYIVRKQYFAMDCKKAVKRRKRKDREVNARKFF